jgi:hypothetical protein
MWTSRGQKKTKIEFWINQDSRLRNLWSKVIERISLLIRMDSPSNFKHDPRYK